MMQKYKKGLILVAFTALLGIAYILRNPEVLPTNKSPEALFPGFTKKEIDKIKIDKGKLFSNVLVKKDGNWVVENKGGFPADKNLVESVLATASKLQKEELVGKSKANHGKFGVDASASSGQGGLRVKLSGEGKSYELIVGDRGPGFSSAYFRRAGENEVYLANQDLDLVFGEDEYRDLRLGFKVQGSRLKGIRIENKNGTFEIERKDGKWILTKPEEKKDVVQSRAEDLVSRLTTLKASDATSSASLAETGLEKPVITVKIKGEKTEDILTIGGKNEFEQRYAQVSGGSYIYLLAPSSYGTLEEFDLDYFLNDSSPAE